jgi:hypothetical protein
MQINASNYRHFNRPEDVKLIGDQPFGVSNVNGQAVVREMPQPGAVGTPGPTFAPPAAGGGAGPSGGVVNRNSLVTQPNVNALNAQGGATPPVVATPPVAGAPPVVATGNPATPWKIARPPVLTEVDDPDVEGQKLKVDANIYKQGTGLGAPGVLGVARTEKLTPQQTLKLKAEMGKDFKAVEKTVAETDALLESIDAVRNSNLERVAGPVDARTFTMTNEGKLAETRFENLKGKVTAIAKTASTMTGAIGSIANQEWQILANQIAVLDLKNGKDPSLEQIDQLERQAMSIANRMRAGFERQYGEHLDTLGPQYKELPNVTYTPGSAGYTPTGKKTPTQSSATPASTGNIADNAGVARVINFGDMPK